MTKTTRPTTLSPLALALCAAAASRALAACGGDACPSPVFGEPVTVTWPPASATVDGVTPVVLRWSAANDPLPERYYEPFSVEAPPDGGRIPTDAARRTGVRELTFDMRNLDAYVRATPRFTARLRFPDTMGYVPCSHPGMADQYVVDVTFDFNAAARTGTARFGQVQVAAGACDVAAPGAGGRRGAHVAALVLLTALLGQRRRLASALGASRGRTQCIRAARPNGSPTT